MPKDNETYTVSGEVISELKLIDIKNLNKICQNLIPDHHFTGIMLSPILYNAIKETTQPEIYTLTGLKILLNPYLPDGVFLFIDKEGNVYNSEGKLFITNAFSSLKSYSMYYKD